VSEDSARTIVRQALLDQYKSRYPTLKEISVSPSKLPNRTDWIFTYEDSLKRGLKEGSPRMDITVRGKELAGIKSYLFIPEETQRLFDKQSQMAVVLRIIGSILVFGFLIFAAVQGILAFSRNQLDKRVLLRVFLMLAVLYLARGITTWDYNEGQLFNPIQPYNNQLISFIVSFLVGFLFQNGFIAALAPWPFIGYSTTPPGILAQYKRIWHYPDPVNQTAGFSPDNRLSEGSGLDLWTFGIWFYGGST
jgi:hypothetical protein